MSDLWSLARNNDVSGLKNLFEKGIGIKAVDENGSSLLHHAAETNSTDVIIYLIERGADIEIKDKHGFTPVLRAANTNPPKEEAILILVSYGANPSTSTEDGLSLQSFEFSEGFSTKLLAAKQYWINSSSVIPKETQGFNKTKNITTFGTVSLAKSGFTLSSRRGSILNSNNNNHKMTEDDILRMTSRSQRSNIDPEDLKFRRSTAAPKTTNYQMGTMKSPMKPNLQTPQKDFNRMRSTSAVPSFKTMSVPNSPMHKSSFELNQQGDNEPTPQPTPNILEATKKKKVGKKDKTKKKDKAKKEEKKKLKEEEKVRAKEEKSKLKEEEKSKLKVKENKSEKIKEKKKLREEEKAKAKEEKSKLKVEEKAKKKTKKKVKTEPSTFGLTLQPISEEKLRTSPRVITPRQEEEEEEEEEYVVDTYSPPPSTSRAVEEEIEPVNIDAVTEVLCKFVKEAVHRNLSQKFADFGPLFQATKELSTTFKKTNILAEKFSTTLDPEHRDKLVLINHTIKTELVTGLYNAIKSVNQQPPNLEPLKDVVKKLTHLAHDLYVCLESVDFNDVMSSLQSTVLKMKQFVTAAKMLTEETFQYSASSLVVTSMELCSFVHDYVFIDAKSKTNKRLMNQSCFATIQSIRSLILSIKNVHQEPNNEVHGRTMATVLKDAAENIRIMSKCLKDENSLNRDPSLLKNLDSEFQPISSDEVEALFTKAIGFMANARSKYASKSNNILSEDEKSILNIVLAQSQLLKHIGASISQEKFELLMGAVLLSSENVTKMSNIILPITDLCMNPLLVQEIVQCLENTIRASIQLKIISASISVNPSSLELQEHVGHTALMWSGFTSLLLDAVWRAIRVAK